MQTHGVVLNVQSTNQPDWMGQVWVIEHMQDASQALLAPDLEDGEDRFMATIPLHVLRSCGGRLQYGDEVIVSRSASGCAFILGVLQMVHPRTSVLKTSAGVTVQVEEACGEERVELKDPSGRLVCEYHSGAQKLVVHNSSGGIDIRCAGDLVLDAGGDVKIQGTRGVFSFQRLETIVGVLWMRSRNLFQEVSETWQLRTSRYRVFATMSALLHAKWIRSKADRTHYVEGDQVALN